MISGFHWSANTKQAQQRPLPARGRTASAPGTNGRTSRRSKRRRGRDRGFGRGSCAACHPGEFRTARRAVHWPFNPQRYPPQTEGARGDNGALPGTGDVVTEMFEPRASRTATAFLSIRHVIDASCISPSGIGDAKQIGSGGDANAPWVRRRVRTGRWRYSARQDPFDSSRCGAWCGYSRRAHLGLVGRRWGRAPEGSVGGANLATKHGAS